jgi:hypothetical protein
LTRGAQIAIVRRFREYSVCVVRETRRTEGGEKPTQSEITPRCKAGNGDLRYTEYKRFTVGHSRFLELNVVSLRPIAIVPATPSTLDGLCGPEQRNGVGSSWEVRERRSITVDCLRLACCTASQTQQQGELGPEALQRPHSFCVYGKKRSLNPPASDMRFVVRFCALTKEF